MKRYIIFLLTAIIGLSAFSQSPSKSLCLRPAYPLAIGETQDDRIAFSNNGLYMYDIIQDTLSYYEIGHIDMQTVRYTEEGLGFYVKADSLHSNKVVFSYDVEDAPEGPIEFNETTGRFKYYPKAEDYNSFFVTFHATDGTQEISERVKFNLMPQTIAEEFAFRTEGTMPDGQDYTLIAEDSTENAILLNNMMRKGRKFSLSGKDVIFDENVQNKVFGLSGRDDICELNIFAERLVIRSALTFPQTDVTIYAKELVFEDHGNEISSINTSPLSISTLENAQGKNGGDAGNISLFVRDIKGNPAKRFILNGAKGQSTNRNGKPGNGGNGGTIVSTVDISHYCDFARGSGGVNFDVAADGSINAGTVIAAGKSGGNGHFEFIDKPFAYLHPFYIGTVIRQVNDAFVNNYTQYVLQTCSEYKTLINEYMDSDEWSQAEEEDEIELKNELTEIEGLLFKLNQGLDYFGNPVGWTPLLSFEVMLTNFDNEVDRAIPTLYTYYWLSRVDQTLQNKVAANQTFANQAEQNIQNDQEKINNLVLKIPVLEDQIKEVESMIEIVNQKITDIENRLMAKARHNVKKRNRLKKAGAICKSVASAISVCGPWGAAIGSAMSVASNFVFATGKVQEYTGLDTSPISDLYNDANNIFGKPGTVSIGTLKKIITDIPWKKIGDNPNMLSEQFEKFSKAAGPLISNVTNLSATLSKGSTPQSEVENEFNRLCAENPEWNELRSEMNDLNNKKTILVKEWTSAFTDINTTIADVSDGMISLDALRRKVFDGNSKRDLNAMQYIEKMEQKAKFRLLKYHYYLRKAYEYRLLKPYKGEFNLVGLFERFEQLGSTFGDIVNPDAYSTLGAVFKDVVSQMAEEIIDEYSVNYPEQSAPITIVIPREQLDVINGGEDLVLNLHSMGIFAPDEENVRIVNLDVQHIDTHVDGNVGYSGYMDLNMTHEGISRFRKDGQLYWFDHRSQSTTSPHTWGVRYDAVSKQSTMIQPSAATSSLLASILKVNTSNNIMLFSRPSAWGNLTMSKKVHTSGGADIVVDSLVLRLQYDFTRRPNNLRNIDITANEELLPYIACSTKDVNGRSNGSGTFYRSYNLSNQSVSFSAIPQYGSYYFENWSDRSGKIVSEEPSLKVSCSKDQFYKANYVRRPPILSIRDTVYVGYEGGTISIPVDNMSSGDTEMEWYVTDSLSSWVHVQGEAEGIDKGLFTLRYDLNESGLNRTDSIKIIAPEATVAEKTVYIVQVDDPTIGIQEVEVSNSNVHVFPNPTRDYVIVEGDGIVSVQVYTISGIKIINYYANGQNRISISLGSHPKGVYMISVKTREGNLSQKVLKI